MALAIAVALGACSSSSSTAGSRPSAVAIPTTTTVPPVARMTHRAAVSPIYSQGLARFGDGWVFSGTRWLAHTDGALHQTAINSHAIPPTWLAKGYDHIGDIDIVGDVLYAPYEEPNYSLGHQATATYDARTLRFESAVVLQQHQNSFVTVDPKTMIAYSMDQFGGGALLRYDVAHAWKRLAPLKLSRFVDKVQGADIADGAAWLSTDDAHKELYRVDLETGHVDALVSQGFLKGEGEGIDATSLSSGLLHALVVPPTLAPVYLQDFRTAE
ncbi:MAG TPA: hypothetical protein VH914_08015 [Acidimicrobiia bacterium]|nr:hypothetical protein [Acidimicrobiia bacterium]